MGTSREIKDFPKSEMDGAGMLPRVGPGKAAMRNQGAKEMPDGMTGSKSKPSGMKVEREGE